MPRLSYLPFILPRIHSFFLSSLIDPTVSPQDAWLSFEDVPLKWHYPIGLLFDLHPGIRNDDADPDLSSEKDSEEILPWKLTLHYTNFPLDQLIQMDPDHKVLLDTFINSVKEADFIRNGTAKVAMGMSKGDSDTLWRSVQTRTV